MIEMELTGVRVELPTNQPIVLLRERGGERYLPIWIGAAEAAAIALSLQGVQTPRPMTHDLMKTILEDLRSRSSGSSWTTFGRKTSTGRAGRRTAGD
jgi:bifunctional DNase/RNase